jgi:hypothetical protein
MATASMVVVHVTITITTMNVMFILTLSCRQGTLVLIILVAITLGALVFTTLPMPTLVNCNKQRSRGNNRSNRGANGNGNNRAGNNHASNNVAEPATNSAVAEINMAEPDEDLTIGLTPIPNVQESGVRAGMEPRMFASLVTSPGIDIDSFSCSSLQERTTAQPVAQDILVPSMISQSNFAGTSEKCRSSCPAWPMSLPVSSEQSSNAAAQEMDLSQLTALCVEAIVDAYYESESYEAETTYDLDQLFGEKEPVVTSKALSDIPFEKQLVPITVLTIVSINNTFFS